MTDFFSLPGRQNIQQEAHSGIINRKLTVGIPYKSLARIDGLWAPPYLCTNFRLNVTVGGQEPAVSDWTWWPFKATRTGRVEGVEITSHAVLVPGRRAGLLAVKVTNRGTQTREVPLRCEVAGAPQASTGWGFRPPVSAATTKLSVDGQTAVLPRNDLAIALRAVGGGFAWDAASSSGQGDLVLKPGQQGALFIAFAIGKDKEAAADCQAVAADPSAAMKRADASHAAQVHDLFEKLPRLESSSSALVRWYDRSLVHFLTNRWDVPEFALKPYHGTGSIRGGCLCCYLWNYGEVWEVMPLFDPAAHRQHILQFLREDMTRHLAFDPVSGKGLGPHYPINQEKIVGLVYYHVKNTGDAAFLGRDVNGKSVLEHAVAHACFRDDLSKGMELIDYGPANDHLELRRGYPYNHKMPDLNGRRYGQYLMAARLADVAGKPRPQLRQRAEELKKVLKAELWNARHKWFDFMTPKGRDLRWTNQMFKLFSSGVLDEEMEQGLLGHLNEKEFLSDFGLHSLAKGDVAYDPRDIDNGGPGSCTSFPPQIAERLYKCGRLAAAEDLVGRTLWWADVLPYWPDSMVADRKDYRRDTPLQCMVDGVAIAQCVIFGMFGIEAGFDGGIVISPHPPKFATSMALKGVKLRGATFDVLVEAGTFRVTAAGQQQDAKVGQAVLLKDGRLTAMARAPQHRL